MDRLACVDVTALPLQLLLQRHPDWHGHPVAVVAEDKPQGRILWVNRAAHQQRVRRGLRYAGGLAICAELRAGVVPDAEVAEAIASLTRTLQGFSPEVEPSPDEAGVFWLNATGFTRLYPTLVRWAEEIAGALRVQGLHAAVVVGFDRFATYAIARRAAIAPHADRVQVLATRPDEAQLAGNVPLHLLAVDPRLRENLARLGIETVGELRRLPAQGLGARFGTDGASLQQQADGTATTPLRPAPHEAPVQERYELEPDEHAIDRSALLFLVKRRLAVMCRALAARGQALAGLALRILLDGAAPHEDTLRPAEPTLDEVEILDLVRLHLESLVLAAPLVGFELCAEGRPATPRQLQLFEQKPRRDLRAGNQALARLRAELGAECVVRAVLRDGHLPEARYGWEPLARIAAPTHRERTTAFLVRRILQQPRRLADQHGDADGWFVGGLACGPARHLAGPFLLSGGWWQREIERQYYFAVTRRGDVLWMFHDRTSRRWFVHGAVE